MRQSGGAYVYEAAARFRELSLRSDGSLFVAGATVWSPSQIDDLHRRYNQHPDLSANTFVVKLRGQLANATDMTIQLAAEALYLVQLIADDTGGAAKRRLLQEVLSWMESPCTVPHDLNVALDHGLVSGGLTFKTLLPYQLQFLVDFGRQWKGLSRGEQEQAVTDPWAFKAFLWNVPIERGYGQREALLHLLFPDTFEDIIARDHKTKICATFSDYVTQPDDDVDRRLQQIRAALTSKFGEGFSYYDPEVRPLWEPVAVDAAPWDDFFRWAAKVRSQPSFQQEERTYKLQISERIRQAIDRLVSGGDWSGPLSEALRSPGNNLTRWQANQSFLNWCETQPGDAAAALTGLWTEGHPLTQRLGDFLQHLPDGLLSGSDLLRMLAVLLMGANPIEWPPITASVLAKACRLTGYPQPSPGGDEGQRYRHALTFFDRLIEEGRRRNVHLTDRLDAQGTMWATVDSPPPEGWTDDERIRFLAWRGETAPPPPPPRPGPEPPPPLPQPPSLQQLADELFMPIDFLTEIVDLVRSRKQIIIYGPPGTGKTYTARKLAEYLTTRAEQRELVQFHPSYSYEDFVQGFRPTEDAGSLTYALKPGPLLRLARRAAAARDDHVLVIDEINRGNLPRILGELLFALEYRGERITLMYEEQPFSLPPNLLVIGTMNTADRSIGLIDAALRRRFHFVRMFPGEVPLEGLLRTWLDKNKPDMLETADIVDRLNDRLRETLGPHLQVGYSHFLRDDLSQEVLTQIWANDIMPLLEDQFFGREEELKAFSLESLREHSNADDQAAGAGVPDGSAEPN